MSKPIREKKIKHKNRIYKIKTGYINCDKKYFYSFLFLIQRVREQLTLLRNYEIVW